MGLLGLHLAHGAMSMVQTIGWMNRRWRALLARAAIAYGVVIFAGFASIPVAVLIGGLGRDHLAAYAEVAAEGGARR